MTLWAAIFTGAPPAVNGIPGNEWLDRFESDPAVTRTTKYLIVAMEGMGHERWILGLIVDRVLDVMRIPREAGYGCSEVIVDEIVAALGSRLLAPAAQGNE